MTSSVSSSQSGSIEAAKNGLRRDALALRDSLSPEQRVAAAAAVAARDLPVTVTSGMIVSGFWPIKTEINPLPLVRRFADVGASLALPVVVGWGEPLLMRAWSFGEPLGSGAWGIREPLPQAAEVFPDVLIVPLLAFDSLGNRIGYGAGYYDLTIARLRARKRVIAIGLAFACQQVAQVPSTPRDARLDLVLTEAETFDCRKI